MFCNFKHNSSFDLHKIYLNSDYYTYILEDYKRFLNCTIWCIWKGSRKTDLHAWKGKSLVNALSFHVLPHFLYIYLSFNPYIYPSIHPFIYLSIHLSLCLSSYLSNYPSFYPTIYPVSIYSSIQLYFYPSIHLSLHQYISLSTYLSIYPSVYPATIQYIHLSIYLSIYPVSIYVSIYLSGIPEVCMW